MAKNKHNAAVGSDVDRSDARIKKTGEVFTPMALARRIVAELPQDKLADKTSTFLDNSCGCGNFLVALKEAMIEAGLTHLESIDKLYGVDLMPDNIKETCANLGVEFGHPHFVVADGLAYHYRFDGTPAEEQRGVLPL